MTVVRMREDINALQVQALDTGGDIVNLKLDAAEYTKSITALQSEV